MGHVWCRCRIASFVTLVAIRSSFLANKSRIVGARVVIQHLARLIRRIAHTIVRSILSQVYFNIGGFNHLTWSPEQGPEVQVCSVCSRPPPLSFKR